MGWILCSALFLSLGFWRQDCVEGVWLDATCSSSFLFVKKNLLQESHLLAGSWGTGASLGKGRFVVSLVLGACSIPCFRGSVVWHRKLAQCLQSEAIRLVCILSWVAKFSPMQKLLLHFPQVWGFEMSHTWTGLGCSPMCMGSCLLRQSGWFRDFLQISHFTKSKLSVGLMGEGLTGILGLAGARPLLSLFYGSVLVTMMGSSGPMGARIDLLGSHVSVHSSGIGGKSSHFQSWITIL